MASTSSMELSSVYESESEFCCDGEGETVIRRIWPAEVLSSPSDEGR